MGDLNIRIGEEQQYSDAILEYGFHAGLENRKSRDKISNSYGKRFLQFCNFYGLVILNRRTTGDEEGCYTFVGASGNSVNDICSVSMEMLMFVDNFEVGGEIWSDHMPITLNMSFDSIHNTTKKVNLLPKLKWNKKNRVSYCFKLNEKLYETRTRKPDLNLNDLNNLIIESYERPKCRGKQVKFKNKWFDDQCRIARDKSFSALNDFRNSQSADDKQKYTQQNSKYQAICKRKKIEYYKQLEEKLNYINDSKQWWQMAKEIRNKENYIGNEISASSFKEYFRSLLNPQIKVADIEYAANLSVDTELEKAFTVQEIKLVLSKAKENKASGEDRIPYEFFVNASDEYLNALADVYTNILNANGSVELFERSIVFPIYKKGDVNQPSNYRGISFTNCVGKIMMGAIHERLNQWVKRNNKLYEFQAGFRKGYSTIDNIYNLTAIVNLKLYEGRKVYAFFVDFRAAFDRVPRKLLIYKLHQMGMSSKVVTFIENVYKSTKSAVWTGDELSGYFDTNIGVKQGCLLSPLLFALYLNDLHDYLKGGILIDQMNIRLLMYADDIVLLADDKNVLQRMINNLEVYCNTWGMEINLTKSEIVIFRKGGRIGSTEKWNFKGENIRIVNEYKYLGILLTPTMSYSKHVCAKNDAAKVCINITWKNFIGKRDVSLKAKWKLFQAACRSIQSYGAHI